MAEPRECKDCAALPDDQRPRKWRPIAGPGPRCRTHLREFRNTQRAATHARYVANTYGLPEGLYDVLYKAQGGKCAWCRIASGRSRKLAVDHDHSCCSGPTSCGRCVRGLLCSACNSFLGRQMRDNPESIRRGAQYVTFPPAQQTIMAWNGGGS